MNSPHLLLLLLLLLSSSIPLLSSSSEPPPTPPIQLQHHPQQQQQQQEEEDRLVSFRPSVAIVIGIFSIMLSLTFLLVVYGKFCHSGVYDANNLHQRNSPIDDVDDGSLLAPNSRFSGLDKSVVESLPFFRFSSLKGLREGLECAVCLSPFDDAELLRLLPRCNHAFHLHCIDRWLESHSTCPLCRTRIDPDDATLFLHSSSRSLLPPNDMAAELDLYVERELHHRQPPPARFGGSFRWGALPARKPRKGEALLGGDRFHRVKHRVIVSDVVFKNRWSDLNPADLMSLGSEMLGLVSSKRFDSRSDRFFPSATTNPTCSSSSEALTIREEMERKRAVDRKAVGMKRPSSTTAENSTSSSSPSSSSSRPSSQDRRIAGGERCASEITRLPRWLLVGGERDENETARRLWLPIARRTLQWLDGRERRSTALPPREV